MSNNRPYHKQKRQPDVSIEQKVIEGFAKGVWTVVTFIFKRGKSSASKRSGLVSAQVAKELGEHWGTVELYGQNPSTFAMAISEADKLLDNALQAAQIPGNTMGERLKAAQHLFSQAQYNQVWEVHKLRNRLAHEVGVVVNFQEVQHALGVFKKALVSLGVFIH